MSTSIQLNNFWIEFLELYKSLPQLWNPHCDNYAHKRSRTKAYQLLLKKYQEFDEWANMDNVKKKIANMRTSFRREYKKVQEDESYEPMLWYYPHMEFLKGQEDNEAVGDDGSLKTLHHVKQEEKNASPPKKRKHSHNRKQHSQPLPQPPAPIEPSHINHTSEISKSTSNNSDEAHTLSATWEVLYRSLDKQQKLYANRAITEVLYLGALHKLHENSYKTLENSLNPANNKEQNPINIIVDAINYNDEQGPQEISNLSDALQNLKLLEGYAMRTNHKAIKLIEQLEETLKHEADVDDDDDGVQEVVEEYTTYKIRD